jgi:two-component system KDP operon response regulator KdpE
MSRIKKTVLVVDDEKSLQDFVKRNLEVRGYRAITAANGMEALAHFNAETIDLVILDLMMPYMNGLETIKRIRTESNVPVIILSALGEEEDKIQALNSGADDYLTKPFGVGELLARIQAVLRRTQAVKRPFSDNRLIRGPLHADFERHTITCNNQPLELTPTEFNLLAYLMENTGKVLPHQSILRQIWGPEYGQETEYLRVYIGRLRQKIEPDPTKPRFLLTERGIGYCFVVD